LAKTASKRTATAATDVSGIVLEATIERPDVAGAVGRIVVPTDEVVRVFKRRGRVPVVATFANGHALRSSLIPRGGRHMLPISTEARAAAAVALGERVRVDLREDLAERTIDVPADLRTALDAAGAGAAFDAMSFSHRKEWIAAIDDAKRPETRTKRIADCVAKVRDR